MYPASALNCLAVRKAALRRQITAQRTQTATAAAQLTRPWEWLERVGLLWRRLAPYAHLAAVPSGFLVRRLLGRRRKSPGPRGRWMRYALGLVRVLRFARVLRRRHAAA